MLSQSLGSMWDNNGHLLEYARSLIDVVQYCIRTVPSSCRAARVPLPGPSVVIPLASYAPDPPRMRTFLSNDPMKSYIHPAPFPSTHPIGINAAATSLTPRSVARRLNCAAALCVSSTSTRMPKLLICRLVSGLSGRISRPKPSISKSGCHHLVSQRFPGSAIALGKIITYQVEAILAPEAQKHS